MKIYLRVLLGLTMIIAMSCEDRPSLRAVKKEHKPYFRTLHKTLKDLVPAMEALTDESEIPPLPENLKLNFSYLSDGYNADFFSFHAIGDLMTGTSSLGSLRRSRQVIYIMRDMLIPQVIPEDDALPYHDVEGVLKAKQVRYFLTTRVLSSGYSEKKATWIHYLLDVKEGKIVTAFPGTGSCTQDEGKSTYEKGKHSDYESCQRFYLGEDVNRVAREVLKAPLTESEVVRVEMR